MLCHVIFSSRLTDWGWLYTAGTLDLVHLCLTPKGIPVSLNGRKWVVTICWYVTHWRWQQADTRKAHLKEVWNKLEWGENSNCQHDQGHHKAKTVHCSPYFLLVSCHTGHLTNTDVSSRFTFKILPWKQSGRKPFFWLTAVCLRFNIYRRMSILCLFSLLLHPLCLSASSWLCFPTPALISQRWGGRCGKYIFLLTV